MELTRRQSEIIRLALFRLHKNIGSVPTVDGSLMQIHDELIVSVKPSEIDMLFQDVQNAQLT